MTFPQQNCQNFYTTTCGGGPTRWQTDRQTDRQTQHNAHPSQIGHPSIHRSVNPPSLPTSFLATVPYCTLHQHDTTLGGVARHHRWPDPTRPAPHPPLKRQDKHVTAALPAPSPLCLPVLLACRAVGGQTIHPFTQINPHLHTPRQKRGQGEEKARGEGEGGGKAR